MTVGSTLALFATMLVLAVVPGVSVLAVTARSAASGFVHGMFTTLGIVAGDVLFIVLAVSGLAVLAQTMGGGFVFVKYLGGAYLIGLGVVLWRSESQPAEVQKTADTSLLSSFATGLLITLGDQKAVLFYLGFLPAFVDLSSITYVDAGIIIGTAVIAVSSAKLAYAYMADRGGRSMGASAKKAIRIAAAFVMIAAGVFLVTTA